MNLWTDPSFELGSAGLTLEGSASVVDAPGYWPDGTKGLTLVGSAPVLGSGVSSRARRTLDTTVGVSYPVSAMVALVADGSPRAPLAVEVRTVGGTVLESWITTTGSGSFALWEPGTFTATEAQTVVEWACEEPSSGGAQWALDEIVVLGPDGGGAVAVSKWAAYQAFVTALKTINGSPYWTSLDSRVFTRDIDPTSRPGAVELPYVSVPLEAEDESIDQSSRTGESNWSLQLRFYAADDFQDDPLDSGSSEACAKFSDDLKRLLQTDPSLSGAVKRCSPRRVQTWDGDEATNYGEVLAVVEFYQVYGPSSLGPTA
jgi:hypothetical protein